MKKIGIVGSRRRGDHSDFFLLKEKFKEIYEEGDTLVSGGCPKGGDAFAEELAKEGGLTITIHYPNWNAFHRGAGFVRNTKIAEDCDVLMALVASDRKGGTEDTIEKATKLGKKIIVIE